MLYLQSKLQIPKEGTKNAIYRFWSAACGSDGLAGRQLCKDCGETRVDQGAFDETSDLAYITEEGSAVGQHQTGVFLSKCYERVRLRVFEDFALESGYPLHVLNVALNMYSGNRCTLVQGVREKVQAHAVDNMLHAFHIRSLRCAGRQVELRKYVDDTVLISSEPISLGTSVLLKDRCWLPSLPVSYTHLTLPTILLV
eukprot:3725011-Amphidinium_carterae.1